MMYFMTLNEKSKYLETVKSQTSVQEFIQKLIQQRQWMLKPTHFWVLAYKNEKCHPCGTLVIITERPASNNTSK